MKIKSIILVDFIIFVSEAANNDAFNSIVMWPSGEVRVCKTHNGGSNPSMTSSNRKEAKASFLLLHHIATLALFPDL